jgi:hypothetical protein
MNNSPEPGSAAPLITFFAVTSAVAWSLWFPLSSSAIASPAHSDSSWSCWESLVPSTVGILLVARLRGRSGAVALLRPLTMLVPLALVVSILFGGATPVVDTTIFGVIFLFAFSIFPGNALGEEVGWRGFAPHACRHATAP